MNFKQLILLCSSFSAFAPICAMEETPEQKHEQAMRILFYEICDTLEMCIKNPELLEKIQKEKEKPKSEYIQPQPSIRINNNNNNNITFPDETAQIKWEPLAGNKKCILCLEQNGSVKEYLPIDQADRAKYKDLFLCGECVDQSPCAIERVNQEAIVHKTCVACFDERETVTLNCCKNEVCFDCLSIIFEKGASANRCLTCMHNQNIN